MKTFLRDTFLGGLFVVLPVTLFLALLLRAHSGIEAVLRPVVSELPIRPLFPGMWAMLVLVALCMIAGLLLRVPGMRGATSTAKRWVAQVLPPARILLGVEQTLLGGEAGMRAALLKTDAGLVPSVVMEILEDGQCAVFVPSSPNATEGSVLIVETERVQFLDASPAQVARCMSQRGFGAGDLLRSRTKAK